MSLQTLRQSDKCFWWKYVNFVQKKIEILGEMLTFSLSVHYYWKWISIIKNVNFVQKKWNFERNVDFFIKYALFAKYAYF